MVSTLPKPIQLESADESGVRKQADVVVVGFGAAGAAAALEAHAAGLNVIVIDRFDGGGATAMSGGVVYAGATQFQRDAGITDTVEDTTKYLQMELKGAASPETIRRYSEESASMLEWLGSHGVPFEGSPFFDKTILPPDGFHLYFAGNEKVERYKSTARPAPRGHRVVGSGMTGPVLFNALRGSVEAAGIEVLTHSPVRHLVIDARGKVIGVRIDRLDTDKLDEHSALYQRVQPLTPFSNRKDRRIAAKARKFEEEVKVGETIILARKAVVLATGGFELNRDIIRDSKPLLEQNMRSMMPLATLGSDGSGIRLGQSVGGVTDAMDSFYLGRVLSPPAGLLNGILVNRDGRRFVSEDAYGGFVGGGIVEQPDAIAWLILSARHFRAVLKEIVTGGRISFRFYGFPALLNVAFGGTKRARTIEALGRKCRIDVDGLRQTVAEYNERANSRASDPLGKAQAYFEPLGTGPFYALNVALANRFAFTQILTLGGLKVDETSGEVLRVDGKPIRGLYAAGRVAAGLCSKGYISGMSLGDAVFSGRRASQHAATRGSRIS